MLNTALLNGAIIAACFPIGAALLRVLPLNHRRIAAIMSLGAGLLLGAIGLELFGKASDGLGVAPAIGVFLLAAALFSGVNAVLSGKGAKHRKRCGECVSQPSESEHQGSGKAIAIGTVMDALPEAIVLGVTIAAGGPVAALVAALAFGNLAQSMSSSAGLKDAGRPPKFIFGLWASVALLVLALTVGSALILGGMGEELLPYIEAFSAGILLAMIAEAMLPEAFHKGPRLSGFEAAAGFAAFALLVELL